MFIETEGNLRACNKWNEFRRNLNTIAFFFRGCEIEAVYIRPDICNDQSVNRLEAVILHEMAHVFYAGHSKPNGCLPSAREDRSV